MTKNNSVDWLKLVSRRASLAFQYAFTDIKPYFKKLIDYDMNYFWFSSLNYEAYWSKTEVYGLGVKVGERVKKDINFATTNVDLCKKLCAELVEISETLKTLSYRTLTDKELSSCLKSFLKPYYNLIPFLLLPHAIERSILGEVENLLSKIVEKDTKQYRRAIEIFTTSIEDDNEESESALEIAAFIKKFGWNKKSELKVVNHMKKFSYLPLWDLNDKPLTLEYFKDEVNTISANIPNPLKQREQLRLEKKKRKDILNKELRVLGSKEIEPLVYILQSYIYLRTYRKNSISKAHYNHLSLLNEIARRMNITEEEIKYLTYKEILAFLNSGKKVTKSIIDKRISCWAVLSWEGKQLIFSGEDQVVKAAKKYGLNFDTEQLSQEVKGRVACRGVVEGRVTLIKDIREIDKIKKGDILVTVMTTPDYMKAIYKCRAIVTDEGGVTCHAAIISRELNLPCIIGTGNATLILKDGDFVRVNADEGFVRKLN